VAGHLHKLPIFVSETDIDLWFTLPTKSKTGTVIIQDIRIAIA
jgi:hypothetical protein